ncbi:DUF4381 domain-containing protein [Marinimicrobium agarilyticum]|uniref:DUF4381 domain-containing protein n=1 Tax=Marinimicrobium agarilyticum TaxID=306546 RepID=UPI000411DFCE|nr:DUF4381 domain-containing protein [Marinimicrobium agarilyticum]
MNPQDPLAQLKDIHLPEPVGWWPLAWGWWLLIALLLIALGLIVWRWRARRRRQRYRQEALAVLRHAYQRYRDEADDSAAASRVYLQTVSELLRRTALSALPANRHSDVATLGGQRWLRFLDASAPVGNGFTEGPGAALAQGPYQPNPAVDVASLDALAARWIKRHSLNRKTLPHLMAEVGNA